MSGPGAALELADWRRQIAELYADVRRMARLDPEAAHTHWRTARERLYREHPQSPVPPHERRAFRARHFPYDAAFRFEIVPAPSSGEPGPGNGPDPRRGPAAGTSGDSGRPGAVALRPMAPAGGHAARGSGAQVTLPVSRGDTRAFDRVAWLDVPFRVGSRRLALYWLREYSGGLLLPFADATGGHETYPAGRYLLDTAKGADLGPGVAPGSIVLDFNFAFQPSCAFDTRWACPLAPAENRLDVEVRAGERTR
jgi:uncharacterized protein